MEPVVGWEKPLAGTAQEVTMSQLVARAGDVCATQGSPATVWGVNPLGNIRVLGTTRGRDPPNLPQTSGISELLG